MKHIVTHITGAEDWEMLYIDGEQTLAGHQIYAEQLLEELSKLDGPFNLITYNWIGDDETEAWEKVFFDSAKTIDSILIYLETPEFEKTE